MIRLVRVELTRYRSRRVIALLILLAAVLVALVAAKSAWDTRPVTASEVATAKKDADLAASRSDIKADLATCLADPANYLGTGATAQECRDTLTASPNSYLPRAPLDLEGTLKGNGLGAALLVAGLLVVAACAFAGSDWNSGSMTNQLLFESSRTRVWTAKAVAVTLSSAVVSFVVLGGFWLALYLVAAGRGVPHGSALVSDVGWHLLRAVVLSSAASLGAFALTMLFRHSVATLALLFTYSVGGEILIFLLPFDGLSRWSLGNNIFGWLETHFRYVDPTVRCAGLDCFGPQTLSHTETGLYLLMLLVVAVATSLFAFRRRDL